MKLNLNSTPFMMLALKAVPKPAKLKRAHLMLKVLLSINLLPLPSLLVSSSMLSLLLLGSQLVLDAFAAAVLLAT